MGDKILEKHEIDYLVNKKGINSFLRIRGGERRVMIYPSFREYQIRHVSRPEQEDVLIMCSVRRPSGLGHIQIEDAWRQRFEI